MINVVGIVGGGIMGAGIAEVAARSGCEVVLREVNEAAVEGAQTRLTASLDKAVRNGKLPQDERNAIVDRVRFTDALDDLVRVRPGRRGRDRGRGCQDRDIRRLGQGRQAGCAAHQQHIVDTDHETRRGDTAARNASSECTSSTRRRYCRWSRSSRVS